LVTSEANVAQAHPAQGMGLHAVRHQCLGGCCARATQLQAIAHGRDKPVLGCCRRLCSRAPKLGVQQVISCHCSKVPMPKNTPSLDAASASRVIEMAWQDRTPFEAILVQFKLAESQVIALMRRELKPSSFRMWRKRVRGRVTKHAALAYRVQPSHSTPE
jgi:uncharacterized protein (TIGR03643 family)